MHKFTKQCNLKQKYRARIRATTSSSKTIRERFVLLKKVIFTKKYFGFLILQNDTLASHLMAYEAWKSGLTKRNYPLV